jgi:hypothetical protein
MVNPVGNERKLGELILYISLRSLDDPRFGATKLNKLLYFSDFLAMSKLGSPITAVAYQHLQNGPAPRHLEEVRDDLVEKKALAVANIPLPYGGLTLVKTYALRNPDLSEFSGAEIDLINSLIKLHWNDNADMMSRQSHNYVGYKMTKMYETIPYESIFLSDAPLTDAEIYRGQELARELGWAA